MNLRFTVAAVLVLLMSCAAVIKPASASVTALYNWNIENVVIVLGADAAKDEQLAATELQEYLQKISDARPEIRTVAPADMGKTVQEIRAHKQLLIRLGQAALPADLSTRVRAKSSDPATFVVKVATDGILVAGLSPEGTLFGTYELLEQMGVRWFMPGELGTVIPKSKTFLINEQETIQAPSFAGRWHNAGVYDIKWGRRVRMGGPYFPPAHGIPGLPVAMFAKHPEYFALYKGQRIHSQHDVSNPEVVRIATEATREYFRKNPDAAWIGMGPNDGGGFCECEKCRALDGGDWDPFTNEPSVTDRYLWFFGQILDGIKDEFPDKKIGFYSYHAYMRAPVKIKPNPRIVPAFAPITLCRVHSMNNPICPERSYYKKLMADWGKIMPEIYERGYWFNLADPGFPFSSVARMRDEIPTAHALGIKGWRVETMHHWGSETPSLYIATKLMWNHEANVDALLNDFYQKFFGPAEKPMAEYFTMMDAALRDADYHTGCSFNMPDFYPRPLRDRARRQLDLAARSAKTGIYSERVKLFRTSFDFVEAFINMLDHQSTLDFTSAQRDLDKVKALQKQLLAYDPPMVSKMVSELYLKRFFSPVVEQGFARTRGGNELVAALKDEWQFQLDQQKIGEDIGLWQAEARGNNWQTIKTSTESWSDQGLRTYKGEAWYRQEVDIPARFAGKRVFLWFGSVDEKAKVWVNGQFIGISHDATFMPFELDATPAIKPGARNVVTVRVVNDRVDELGTGGLTAPVMFYAPAAGKDAKLENSQPLPPTFP